MMIHGQTGGAEGKAQSTIWSRWKGGILGMMTREGLYEYTYLSMEER